ncbi:hypothetical protein DRJ22_03860 [Candidatus Woesearchaeota archaeon]|nr:MAG: hypothetical protein DRJ22_03860 [Candidatus Woesearchaeota archaeon]
MILKKVVLNNIRSYLNETIEFPESKILLAGDIGAGKSSILLAVEFALFGTLRGELSGSALLRNGAKAGSVDLEFELDSKTYLIHRSLKRTKSSVEQGPGFVLVDGLKRELTPIELKAFVLELLNYPREYLNKSKNLIFRFTIYTPQEEMKRILFEDAETRTGILRRIFNIDKYELIKSNATSYMKFLREKQRAFEAMVKDLKEKEASLAEKKNELKAAEDFLDSLMPKIKESEVTLEQKQAKLEKFEKAIKERQDILRIFEKNKAVLEQKKNQAVLFEKEIADIDAVLSEKLGSFKDKSQEISKKEKEIQDIETTLRQFIKESAGVSVLIEQSRRLAEKISSLDQCPTCLQKVDESHKSRIFDVESKKQAELKEKSELNAYKIRNSEENIKKLRQELADLRKLQQEYLVFLQKKKSQDEKRKRKDLLSDSLKSLSREIKSLEKQQAAYERALAEDSLDAEFKNARAEVEVLRKEHQSLLLEESKFNERVVQVSKYISLLERDINSKLEAKKNLEHSKKLHNWFSDYFMPLVDTIEKHVMARIHQDFNDLFQQWFSVLVDDDLLQASLDDSFTPLIIQNGFDVEFNNLSGGEKTACALAYRLALNKVVNDIFTEAKTKDLIILDEPTDGFSEEQLDRMREVLEQLGLRQVLIVSHEPKMEGFVDDVIRVQKQGHVSKVLRS